MELLDRETLTRGLSTAARDALAVFQIFAELDSTNAFLLRQARPEAGRLHLALAELQTAGRGRRGRSWSMPFGSGVMLSVGWRFARPPAALPALSLAAGVAVRDALSALSVPDVALKWPNDLVWGEGKLGGILVEASGNGDGACFVVLGIGINVHLDEAARAAIQPSWGRGPVDLRTACGGPPPARNALAAALVNGLFAVLQRYEAEGFEPYQRPFGEADFLHGRPIRVTAGDADLEGHGAGVDSDGALLVRTPNGLKRVVAGEVRLQSSP